VPQPSLDLIRGVPLFAAADDRFLERLAGEFMERTFSAGETIAEEGESGRTFIVIESGQVTVTGTARRSVVSVLATRSARWP
jgi:CRP-like cAMP-binding protein